MAKFVCLCNGTTEGVQNIHALEYDLFIYSRNQSSAEMLSECTRRRQILFFPFLKLN